MKKNNSLKNKRVGDPYVDRRSGGDRRQVYDSGYWESGGIESRTAKDRRLPKERRASWVKVSKWSSIRIGDQADQ